jgi:CRP-like cAMP-binding protein
MAETLIRDANVPHLRAPSAMGRALNVLDRKVFYKGKDIFREGQPGRAAYIVESGEIEIAKSVDGRRVVLGRVGRGGVFGEMALLDEAPRMASATALRDTVLIVVPEATVAEKMAAADPFIRALVRIMTRNVRSLTQDMVLVEAFDLEGDPKA